jgi:predicted nucleic acid-binding protein
LKTIRVSDGLHGKLTRLLGEMIAKTGKPKTYNEIISALTDQSVIISTELLEKIDTVINIKQFGHKTREQFIEDAVTAMFQHLSKMREQKKRKVKEDSKRF